MIGEAFGLKPGELGYLELREEFLALYAQRLLRHSRLFDGAEHLVLTLEQHGIAWGIVTNKSHALARALVQGLGLSPAALIGGDSTPFTKPHPEPLLEAARQLGVPAQGACYVGDDPRDMRAGRAAGMGTVAAAWGYLGIDEPIEAWASDATLQQPIELLNWLGLA